uniref:Importin 4 n=1 Tax=Anolis carolinensis TaxID=28377 RepID=A0A803SW12_ANOCA
MLSPQIRQLAAVLVRRRLTKHWKKLRLMLFHLFLSSTRNLSSSHKVSLSLAQLAAVILKNETLEKWPQLLHVIQQGARSRDPIQCQVGLLLLHSALELDPELFAPHYKDLLRLFHQTLNIRGQPAALYYSLRSLTTMVPGLGSDEMSLMSSMVPKLLSAIRELISVDETQASEVMEVLDELMETEVSIIAQHATEIVGFCLEIASNRALGDSLRVKALSCISFFIKLKSKTILKQKLLSPILTTLFPIMSAEPPPGQMDAEDEQTEEDIEERAEVQTPKHYAAQVLCGSRRVPCPLQLGLSGLLVLLGSILVPQRHLQPMLQVVCRALLDESQVVRNAALFALGQFSENLQPDIANYSDDIMPLLLRYLEGVQLAHTSHMAKAYYALENFVENLGDKIAPYLPSLMERMLTTLSLPGSPRTKELSVSAIGAIAQAAQESIMPYFQAIMDHLMGYLLTTQEDLRPVQIQSVETLSVLATVLKKDIFLPLAEQCCQLGLDLCDRVDDPDLRRCTYSLFGSLATVLEDGISPYLPRITTFMLYSLKSTEGFEVRTTYLFSKACHFCKKHLGLYVCVSPWFHLHEEPSSNLISSLLLHRLSVGNVYMDEKEDACVALGEIATCASTLCPIPHFPLPFQCPHIRVRKSAYEALGQFCISFRHLCERDPSEPHTAAFQKLLSMVMPVYIKGIRGDKERQVVMAILESLAKVVKACQQEGLRDPSRLGELCRVVREVLEKKTTCQGADVDEDGDEDDEEEAEYDAMLIEYAGEVIPALAAAAGGETFAPYFAGFLPLLLNKMKPSSSSSDKSFAVGTVAETIQGLGQASSAFVPRLLPLLMGAARDTDKEVRSNAVFGLGVLAEHGREPMHEYPFLQLDCSGGMSQDIV